MALRGVILDVDGTLVDSNDAHASAWVDAFEEFGYTTDFEKVRRCIGMGSDKLIPEIIGIDKDDPKVKTISKRRTEIFKHRYLPSLKPFDRVRQMVEKMQQSGLKVVVASSAKKDELKPLLEVAGITDLIEEKTSSDDAKNSKPDPDIVIAAVKESGFKPHELVMLGDTPYDIEAARKAGVPVIAVRCGGWYDYELKGALAIYDDPADLLANYEKSPLAQPIKQGT